MKKRILHLITFCLFLLTSFNAQSQTVLFDYGSSWKYLDNGSNQGTAWTGTGFSDATWATDTGFFGYGDTWITKYVNACGTVSANPSCTNKYITTYFRKVINIPSVSSYDSVRFSVKRDDGVVVYVNGVEVMRDPNMPTGTISYTTAASTALGGTDEYTPITKAIPISSFVNGNNTIAVEVHQQSGTSSDLGFNMQALGIPHGPAPVTLTFGPYLQIGTKNAVSIRWRTNISSKSKIEVGTTLGTYPIVVNDATLKTDHEIRVTGLTPDTKYYYRIGTDTSVTQGDLNNFFTTAPDDTGTRRVTMAIFGDCGQNDATYQTTSLAAYQTFLTNAGMKAADLMLLVGDNAYNNGTDAEFAAKFFAPYSGNILKNHMLFPAPGNHDYDNGNSARQADHAVPYYSLFSMPTAGESGGVASGTEAYYSYNWGANIHVLSLDSYGKENGGTTRLSDTNGAQVTWIKNDLAANTRKWVIVYFHHPPYSMGSHNTDTDPELIAIRQNLLPILERYGVDLVITGHSHDYERSYLLKGHFGTSSSFVKSVHTTDSSSAKYDGSANSCPYVYPSGQINHGTVYVLSGSSGASGGVVSGSYPHKAMPFSVNDGGMFFLDIKDNRLDAKFIRRDNTIFDKFTIMKDAKAKDTIKAFPGTPVALKATWPGTYSWNTGATTQAITFVTQNTDSMVTVKDNTSGTCLTDQHFIDAICTNPVFTSFPSNMTGSPCNNALTYNVTDTGTPAPALTYTFSGATTGSGSGTGSGSSFNIGVTNVMVTATNVCGVSVNNSFTVTIDSFPRPVTVTGAGTFCDNTTITASNGGSGTIYFQGTTSGGTSTATPSTTQSITSSGTYYFRARSAAGCWGPEGSVAVTINPLPSAAVVSGAGTYCNSGVVSATGGAGGTLYFEGTTRGGTSVSMPSAAQTITTSGTYYFRPQTALGCWGPEDSAVMVINPLPTAVTVSGAGTYCAGTVVAAYNGGSGTIYFQGTTSGGTSTAIPASSRSITASGTYYFRALSALGCWGPEGSVTVTINPLPAVYAITGGGNYCSGGSGVHIGLAGTEPGIEYQAYIGTTPTGTVISGSGASKDLGLFTGGGAYSVVGTNPSTGCKSNMTGSANIYIDPLPVKYTVTGGGSYCAGGTGLHVGLSASNSGVKYQLKNGTAPVGAPLSGMGAALDFGIKTPGGTYIVEATDSATSCTSTMTGSATIVVNTLPAVYTVSGGGHYCASDTGVHVFLSGSESGIQYQLYNGSTVGGPLTGSGYALDFGAKKTAGAYTVIATNTTTSCTGNMNSFATVVVDPLPASYSVTGGGDYCAGGTGLHIGLSGSNSGKSYQLYNGSSMSGTALPGTGSALDFGSQAAAGTYTVIAKDMSTLCTAGMTGSRPVVIDPLPNVYSVTGGGSYCASGSGVHVYLSGSEAGINYQLYNGATTVGGAVAGTSSALDFGFLKPASTYTVSATNATTGCKKSMSSSAVITINPLPDVYTVTGGGSYCSDGSGLNIGLSNGKKGFKYQLYNGGVATGPLQWGKNAMIDFGAQKSAGTYTVVAIDTMTLCKNTMSGSAVINIIPVVTASIYATADPGTRVCKNELVTFRMKSTNGGSSPVYMWKLNGVDQHVVIDSYVVVPGNGDNISVTMTTNMPCATPRTVTQDFTMKVDSPVAPTVSVTATKVAGKVKFTATVQNAGKSPLYTWYLNGSEIAGATSAEYTITGYGPSDSVSCMVTTADACHMFASQAIVPGTLGISIAGEGTDIVILPNPNKGTFAVRGGLGNTQDEVVTLEVTNMLGQVIHKQVAETRNGGINEVVKLNGNIASGMYMLNMHTASGNHVFHVVVE